VPRHQPQSFPLHRLPLIIQYNFTNLACLDRVNKKVSVRKKVNFHKKSIQVKSGYLASFTFLAVKRLFAPT
jgi:hypothetical protein